MKKNAFLTMFLLLLNIPACIAQSFDYYFVGIFVVMFAYAVVFRKGGVRK